MVRQTGCHGYFQWPALWCVIEAFPTHVVPQCLLWSANQIWYWSSVVCTLLGIKSLIWHWCKLFNHLYANYVCLSKFEDTVWESVLVTYLSEEQTHKSFVKLVQLVLEKKASQMTWHLWKSLLKGRPCLALGPPLTGGLWVDLAVRVHHGGRKK